MRLFLLVSFFIVSLTSFGQSVQDDFEGNGTITTWAGDNCGIDTDFSNPFQSGINTSSKVLKYTDSGGSHANVRFDTSSNFDLSTNNTFSIKIYVPSSSLTGNETNQVSLKLQDGTLGSPWVTQSEIIKTISLDQWQTVTFDFANDNYMNLNSGSAAPTSRSDFNRVLLQVNGEGNSSHVIAYIDDFLYDGTITPEPEPTADPVFNNLVWSDEFEGSGAIDTQKWFHQTQIPAGGSWYNEELQHYTDRVDNANLSGGNLNIVAKKETYTNQGYTKQYTSARLNSKFAFKYGKVEVRAKLPTGTGTWPAIWMLGKNITEPGGYWASQYGTTGWPACGEIDIMEHWGKNQNFVQSAMHTPSSSGNTINHGGQTVSTASTDFHIYTLEWSAQKMVFKVDGVHHYTYNPATKNSDTWPYDAEQYLLLNIAIEKEGTASSFTQSAMVIDYVRVYQESTASVASENPLDSVLLFPNPVKDTVNIKIPASLFGVKGTVYSLLGEKMSSFVQDSSTKEYDFSKLDGGIYVIQFETATKTSTYKLLKL